ncbi:SpoIIE family protein phosphatase [Actinacidiphila soli]|uniref:SpoIIE family protein phosphatase n=1 Tax=Actinacidiphila soli TaxID=2487275 RepID=UPI000FCBBD70|nr:SpoIIE family protein phosphatase [Actinacidiphila soli]
MPFDTGDAATAVLDATGTVIGWTRAAERLLGHRPADVLHRSAAALLAAPEDASRAAAVVEHCRTEESWAGFVGLRHRDGRRIQVGLRVSPVHTAPGEGENPDQWVVSAVDMSENPSLAVSGPLLESMLTGAPIGMGIVDPDLRYVWINDALVNRGGVSREQRIGRGLKETLPGLDTDAIEERMRQVLRTGTPIIDYEYRGWTLAEPYRERAYSTSYFRLADAAGTVLGVCYMVMDVTDRWRARERLALLDEAGAVVGSTLDIVRTAQELTDFAVPRLCDFVTVDLLDAVLHGDEPGSGPGIAAATGASLRRTAMRSLREGTPESAVAPGEPIGAPESSPYDRCVVDGKARLDVVLDVENTPWIAEDTLRAARIREYGMRSVMWVPLRARGTVLGVATFVRTRHPDVRSRHPEPFEEDDLLLAEEICARAALCVDNARRFTREHHSAVALQRALLPPGVTGGGALDVASRYVPANVRDGIGGDWFDVIPLSGARIALVVGDVVGHGIHAAATMGRLRTAVHTLADMDLPPDELLAHLDDLVLRLAEEDSLVDGDDSGGDDEAASATVLGASCLYAIYDPVARSVTMARAGHPPPALVTPDGQVSFPDLPDGPPLGLGGLPFESAELELPEGSLIALYTDGLIENSGDDLDTGLDRLGEILAQPGLTLEGLCAKAIAGLVTGPPSDDIALLIARAHALSATQVAAWDLPSDPAVVSGARALAVRQLAEWGLDNLAMTTELVVSELVTNAIRHATGPIRLRLIRQSVLICEVSDTSSTSPRLRHPRTTDEGGRGLFLVAQLTRRWGSRHTPTGKLIWAEQDLPAPSALAAQAPGPV